MAIEGRCHCGAVHYVYDHHPRWTTSCNCGMCRRLAALWIYAPVGQVTVTGETRSYLHGEKSLSWHCCAICGCTTHWAPVDPTAEGAYMAVNLRLAEPDVVATVPVRRFDGADSWEFLDPEPD